MKQIGSRAEVMHGNAIKTSGGLTKEKLKYNKYGKIVSIKASEITLQRINSPKLGGGKSINLTIYTLDNQELPLKERDHPEYYSFYKDAYFRKNNLIDKENNIYSIDDDSLERGIQYKSNSPHAKILRKNNEYYGVLSTNKEDADKLKKRLRLVQKGNESWEEYIEAR